MRRLPAQSFHINKPSSASAHGTTPPVEKACGTASTPVPMQNLSIVVTAPRKEVLPVLFALPASGSVSLGRRVSCCGILGVSNTSGCEGQGSRYS